MLHARTGLDIHGVAPVTELLWMTLVANLALISLIPQGCTTVLQCNECTSTQEEAGYIKSTYELYACSG